MKPLLDLIVFESLNLYTQPIGERSHLYQLKPVNNIDELTLENLTSFICRLAEAHNVSTNSLVSREISFAIGKKYMLAGQSNGIHKIYSRASAINGTGLMALDWVSAIELLTLSKQLQQLTTLNFSDVFPSRNLLRKSRAWCPQCYQECSVKGTIIHDSLNWALDAVKICHKHLLPLATLCPHCKRQMPWLDWSSRPGHCSKCNQWLGSYSANELWSKFKEDEMEWEIWVANNVSSLIVSTLQKPPRQVVACALSKCVELIAEGNVAEFARMIHLPKNTVWLWKKGKSLPPLNKLLRICYLIQIPLVNFLDNNISSDKPIKVLGVPFKKLEVLRLSGRFFDSDKVASLLEKVFLSHEYPPPSALEMANRLGYDIRLLREHYPEICSAISKKHAYYRQACRLKRLELLSKEIQAIAFKLYSEGVYPTRARVAAHLSKPGCFRELAARDALRESHRMLNLN